MSASACKRPRLSPESAFISFSCASELFPSLLPLLKPFIHHGEDGRPTTVSRDGRWAAYLEHISEHWDGVCDAILKLYPAATFTLGGTFKVERFTDKECNDKLGQDEVTIMALQHTLL